LHEPVAQFFTNGGRIISKDLFFSGHVTTIMSLFYPIKNKILRPIVLFLSAMVGVLVLVQHVHYTIDVLMAVVATYLCFLLSKRITAGIKVNEL
jgi:membrane-associated phospholipid phosphatase